MIAKTQKSAFTLVELLVVIAIIGILIGMLLPAVQQVREAARRTECLNNVRQQGLAMHNYHSAFDNFPSGAQPNLANRRRWGVGWQFQLFPFLEQSALFNMTSPQFNAFSAGYGPIYDGKVIPGFVCPSAPFDALLDGGVLGATQSQRSHFYGLAGAVDDTADGGTFSESRNRPSNNRGIISGGGTLLLNSSINIGSISDGTSNTAIIGECSDFVTDAAGLQIRPNQGLAIHIGTNSNQTVEESTALLNNAVHTLTTIRYPINHGDGSLEGVGDGNFNNGLISAHPGGANVCYGDGSCHVLNDDMDLTTLKVLVTRDDGVVLDSF